MIRCIVVPLDGSDRAEQAIPVAAYIARTTGARVLLIRALIVPTTYGIYSERRPLRSNLIQEQTQESRDYLDRLAQSAELAGVPVQIIVKVAAPADVILDVTHQLGADLVVMTSHGCASVARVVMGSVAEYVVHHSPVPVLLLREHEDGVFRFQPAEKAGVLRILVPLDGSPLAEEILEPVHALALAMSTARPVEIHLMLVAPPYVDMPENMPDGLIMNGANAYLERTAQRLRHSDGSRELAVTWSVVAFGDIARAIVAAAEPREARDEGSSHPKPPFDMIAMATHGRGRNFITRLALGSVTDRVLRQSTLPLLLVRPDGAARPISDPKIEIDS